MNNTLLIIDLNNTVIRSLAVNEELSYDGLPTGGIYGFIGQLTARIHDYNPSHIIACTDSPPYLRKELYPEYKSNRKRKDDEDSKAFYQAMNLNIQATKDFLELLKIPLWAIKGLEADDLIAYLTQLFEAEFEQIIIISNDDDLLQLLSPTVRLHRGSKKGDYGLNQFKDEYPMIEPKDWILVNALRGSHNNVEGIKGVGIKTALKIAASPNDQKWDERYFGEYADLIKRNINLITLPFPEYGRSVRKPMLKPPVINERDVVLFLNQFGIEYTGRMSEAFSRYSQKYSFN